MALVHLYDWDIKSKLFRTIGFVAHCLAKQAGNIDMRILFKLLRGTSRFLFFSFFKKCEIKLVLIRLKC